MSLIYLLTEVKKMGGEDWAKIWAERIQIARERQALFEQGVPEIRQVTMEESPDSLKESIEFGGRDNTVGENEAEY